ncbi:TRAP transporter small permease [Bacillus horti]|uniref:TRAP-type C4-dicarboxylate transport system permease small subunit n=1 Tax=Caldalkalibacillus horti TaxID=77523 RepID=A0ABT9VYY2_9BACI|nr:TRAP transporter small permease [Bacillus horti]MDQ0166188.1 TRAP-type C4-dicarboxylate transport system permease small subunit [Bacillus horti]
MLKKIAQGYTKFEDFLTNSLMIGIVVFVFLASVMRWIGSPIPWSIEFAQLLFVWVIFLGANRALREDRHVGVDFFVNQLPFKVKTIIEIIMIVLIMAFLVFLAYSGSSLSLENSSRLINNLGLSYSIVTISVPMGSLLMLITFIGKLKGKIVLLKKPVDERREG